MERAADHPTGPRAAVLLGALVLLVLVAGAGLWRGQHQAMDAIGPRPGVWPAWAFWPGLVLVVALLVGGTSPRSWPRALRLAGPALAVAAFCLTALVTDAAVARLAMDPVAGVVERAAFLQRGVQRLEVAVDGSARTAYSPASAFAGGQQTDSTTGVRHYTPGLPYGDTSGYAAGTPVTLRVDPSGDLYTRVLPAPGQGGYLAFFPRSPLSVLLWGLVVVAGWAYLVALTVASTRRRDGAQS